MSEEEIKGLDVSPVLVLTVVSYVLVFFWVDLLRLFDDFFGEVLFSDMLLMPWEIDGESGVRFSLLSREDRLAGVFGLEGMMGGEVQGGTTKPHATLREARDSSSTFCQCT